MASEQNTVTRAGRPRSAAVDEALLAAAHEELANGGLAGMRIERIAERAGVARTTVYRRYGDLDGVLLMMLDDLYTPLPLDDTGSLRTDLVAMIDRIVDIWRDEGRVRFLAAVVAAQSANAEIGRAYHEQFRRRRADARTLVQRGIARGELPPETDADLLLDIIAGVVAQRVLLSREPLPDGLSAQLTEVVIRGFGSTA